MITITSSDVSHIHHTKFYSPQSACKCRCLRTHLRNMNLASIDLLGIVVLPLDLHLVNVGSIPTGPTHGEGRLQPHPGHVLKSTPNIRKGPRSGLNLEGRLSDPQIFQFVSGKKYRTPSRKICVSTLEVP